MTASRKTGARATIRALWIPILDSLATMACGSKTGLIVPDVAVETAPDVVEDVTDVTDIGPFCTPGTFTLAQRAGDAILVIDRSGSMAQALDGTMGRFGTSKWSLLHDALASTLPTFQNEIQFGALFFPDQGAPRETSCDLPAIPDLDVDPAPGEANAILRVLETTSPAGATPTAAALLRAYTWFARHPNAAHAHYLVLATDGGPNCNAALDPTACVCSSMRRGASCGATRDGSQCLDDMRTVQEIAQIASNPIEPIPTYVIGLAADADPIFTQALTAMAVAGGRPNLASGAPSYYHVQQSADLVSVFGAIQSAIARCTFESSSRPPNPDAIQITLDGAAISRDRTHTNGWDWTDAAAGEITLFGRACDTASAGSASLVATVACDVDGGDR